MKLKKSVTIFCSLFTTCSLLFFSCTEMNVFEKNLSIPNFKWQSNFIAKGSFIIEDTASAYNIYLVLRHTDTYRYNNIWLNIAMQPPSDSFYNQKIDIQLATDATGWKGTGMNDIWEVRELLNIKPQRFKKSGTYNFTIAHIMRDDPLLNIMSVGLRVEKEK